MVSRQRHCKDVVKDFYCRIFFSMFAYVVVMYTGMEEEAIKPMTLFGFFAGIIMSKVIDWFFQDGESPIKKETM